MTEWLWDLPDWIGQSYNPNTLRSLEDRYLYLSGLAMGLINGLGSERIASLKCSLLTQEAIESSNLAGADLQLGPLKAALKQLHVHPTSRAINSEESALAGLISLSCNASEGKLDAKLLHQMLKLVKMALSNSPMAKDPEPSIFARTCIADELERFILWFNSSRQTTPAVGRAAVCLLWFEIIKPFSIGNRLLGRAVAQLALKPEIGVIPFPMISEIIAREAANFNVAIHAAIENENLCDWLAYFRNITVSAQERTIELIRFSISQSRFVEQQSDRLNSRQFKAVLAMFEAGPDGFPAGLSAGEYRSISNASIPTATRDLNSLVASDILRRQGDRRHARYFLTL